jgi:hypothetical protein
MTTAGVDSWIRRGRLHPLYRAVYALGHEAIDPRGHELAAVFAAGDEAALSHQPAGARQAFRPPWHGPIHVTAPRRCRLNGLVVHHSELDPRDRTTHQGIPITTPARTLLDLAEVLPPRQLETALHEATLKGLATDLGDVIARANGRRGAAVLSGLLDDAPTRSTLERDFLALVKDHDLPQPVVNGHVNGYEVDFHWPNQRLVVELDGYRFHGTRGAFERDRERDAELQAAGWRVIRITYRQLHDAPEGVAARLRRALAA